MDTYFDEAKAFIFSFLVKKKPSVAAEKNHLQDVQCKRVPLHVFG
jgi:hypothetical protein